MTPNQTARLDEFFAQLRAQLVGADMLPALILAYPVNREDATLSIFTIGTMDDECIRLALCEALAAHMGLIGKGE